MRKSTVVILLGVLIMGGLTYFIVQQSPDIREALLKEKNRSENQSISVTLDVLQYEKHKTPIKITKGMVQAGELAFSVDITHPLHIAIVASEKSNTPKILFSDARIPPGMNRKVEKADTLFLYDAKRENSPFRFCVIWGNDNAELWKKLAKLERHWHTAPESECALMRIENE